MNSDEFCDLNLIEPERSREQWLQWLNEEKTMVRHRFGDDEEAMELWPDDYYEKMIKWWESASSTMIDPIEVFHDEDGIIRIDDGYHRVAISHLLRLQKVPIIWSR